MSNKEIREYYQMLIQSCPEFVAFVKENEGTSTDKLAEKYNIAIQTD